MYRRHSFLLSPESKFDAKRKPAGYAGYCTPWGGMCGGRPARIGIPTGVVLGGLNLTIDVLAALLKARPSS